MSLLILFTQPVAVDLLLRGNWNAVLTAVENPPTTDHKDSPAAEVPGGFPTQFSGLFVRKTAATVELCLVAEADANTGMGGAPVIDKNGTKYAVYLVETSDPNASPVQIQTTTGIKAVRLKT